MIAVATLWLGTTGQLQLYIHPRYVVFTMIMITIGLIVVVAEMILLPLAEKQSFNCSPHGSILSLVMIVVVAVVALIVRPVALTTDTVTRRGINSGATTTTAESTDTIRVQNTKHLTVKEWAGLLAQTHNAEFFVHRPVELTGFVANDGSNPHVFHVSRFVVTCCAVDARAVGVPVYVKNWQERYKPGEWVTIRGSFISTPADAKQVSTLVVVSPRSIMRVSQPKDPYEQ